MRIIFMGTPEFAVASLARLLDAEKDIVAVVTAPDKPAGRGQKLKTPAVKVFAEKHRIPVLQPLNLKAPEFLEVLSSYKADLQVVVAFRMLPEVVWNMPRLGTVNLHGSLLPQYRGAAPIHHAIIQGEQQTGVTTFLLQHAIDTGHILLQEKVAIGPDTTTGELHDTLMRVGARILLQTVEAIETGQYTPVPQDSIETGPLKPAPKLIKEETRIDWHQPLDKVYNFIRGLSPFPCAFTTLEGTPLKIYRAEKEVSGEMKQSPGSVSTDGKTYLRFATPNGYIRVKQVQLQGKKAMLIEDFLRGYRWQQALS